MNAPIRVADSSPLIALHQTGRLELIEALFSQVLIPEAVAWEISPSVGAPRRWMRVHPVPLHLDPILAEAKLDPGETEAIALAMEKRATVVVLDDRSARIAAERLGLNVIGTLGVLLLAHRNGLIDNIRTELDALLATGFYVSGSLYARSLEG